MRKLLLFIMLFISIISTCFSQDNTHKAPLYFNDLGFQYGAILSLKSNGGGYLSGMDYNLNHGQFHGKNRVYRVKAGFITELDNVDYLHYATFRYGFRSSTNRALGISSTTGSISQLLFELFQSIFPRNFELTAGPTVGYIDKSESNSTVNYHGYNVKNSFLLSLDAGFRLHYNIWRFRITGSMFMAYNLTNNFEYRHSSESNNLESPDIIRWFFKPSVGLSFAY